MVKRFLVVLGVVLSWQTVHGAAILRFKGCKRSPVRTAAGKAVWFSCYKLSPCVCKDVQPSAEQKQKFLDSVRYECGNSELSLYYNKRLFQELGCPVTLYFASVKKIKKGTLLTDKKGRA
jgi:hypothetical protein